ncbi:MAG: hypothetical protein GW789_03735 [Ignavibacteria bacterium]|nr:hypothetical protein [Ignavibacteria bacterium]
MKKFLIISAGMFAGLIVLLFIAPLVHGLMVSLLTNENVSYSFKGIRLTPDYNFLSKYNIILVTLIKVSPVLVSIIAIEISMMLIGYSNEDKVRSGLIVFQLVNIGYLIFIIFLGVLSMILESQIETLWVDWMRYLQVESTQKLLIMFVLLFMVFIYINLTSRRMRNLIPSVKLKSKTNPRK